MLINNETKLIYKNSHMYTRDESTPFQIPVSELFDGEFEVDFD
ncbi:hypothetical protein RJG79_04885 [Mycoplasmatota bacterium WC44]